MPQAPNGDQMTTEAWICFKPELVNELEAALPDLMHKWAPNRDRADYECVFCDENPPRNDGQFAHSQDCLGVKLEEAITDD